VLQCVAVSGLQCGVECGSVWQCMAVCGSVGQCEAVCGSVWQCVAVCDSVWQCVAEMLCGSKRKNQQEGGGESFQVVSQNACEA